MNFNLISFNILSKFIIEIKIENQKEICAANFYKFNNKKC